MLVKYNLFGTYEKIDSKEKLNGWLEEYKGVLSGEMIEYLNSLINLEFSVVRNNINEKDRKLLSELYIYERIAIYNIRLNLKTNKKLINITDIIILMIWLSLKLNTLFKRRLRILEPSKGNIGIILNKSKLKL